MPIRPFPFILAPVIFAAALTSCSSTSETLSIPEIQSPLIVNGELAAPKGIPFLVNFRIHDERNAGKLVIDQRVHWKTSDDKMLKIQPNGVTCIVTGLRDSFDSPALGTEPTPVLSVEYDGFNLDVITRVIPNVVGLWRVSYDSNPPIDLLLVDQQGRNLTVFNHPYDPDTGYLGKTGMLSIHRDDKTLLGMLTSSTAASGLYSAKNGTHGVWSVTKEPPPTNP